jgi:hypothetical protein
VDDASPLLRAAPIGARFAIALAAIGCGLIPTGQGNPAEPILVTGRVIDADGRPVGGASLELDVRDYAAAVNVGDTVPTVFHRSFSANADGTFALHLAPTPELLAFAAKEGGFVNFNLIALWDGTAAPWAFTRHLDRQRWADDPPLVELRPIGSIPGPPGVPAPLPAET